MPGVLEFQSFSTKVSSHFLQILPWILLGPVILDLFFDGFNALNSLDLNLVHQLKPNNMETIPFFERFRDGFRGNLGKQVKKKGDS